MNIDVDKIVVSLDVVAPDAVVVEASAVAPSGIVTEAAAELPTQVIVISHEETPTVTPLQIIDFGSSSIECAFDVTTEQADEVVKGVLCGTINPPTFENADYRLLHGQGSMDLAFAGLRQNTEYFLRPYALSNLGYKYGDVVAQRTKANPIPEEYQLVEYLESTGTQYINTLLSDLTIGMYIEGRITNLSQSDKGFCGNVGPSNVIWWQGNQYIFMWKGVVYYTGVSDISITKKFELNYLQSGKAKIDDTVFASFDNTINNLYSIFLFGASRGGTPYGIPQSKIFNAKFSIAENKVRDMYPVYRKFDSKPGMYDIVNNQFYTNQGTGEFTVGPDRDWQDE